tara:strand:- start:3017 stop:3544 length:528 start_codon:yes stop_codon:yes gene_type:complete
MSDSTLMRNGIIRWYVDEHTKAVEDAQICARLIAQIDQAYPDITLAEPRIARARQDLVTRSQLSTSALAPIDRSVWSKLGAQYFVTKSDEGAEFAKLESFVREREQDAQIRANEFDAVRFLHLVEARHAAKSLAGGAVSSTDSEMSISYLTAHTSPSSQASTDKLTQMSQGSSSQ